MKKINTGSSYQLENDLHFFLFNQFMLFIAFLAGIFTIVNAADQRPVVNIITPLVIMLLCISWIVLSKSLGKFQLARISFMTVMTFGFIPFGYWTSPGSESAFMYIVILSIFLLSFIAIKPWEYLFPISVGAEAVLMLQTEIWFPDHYYVYHSKSYRIGDLSLNFTVVALAIIVVVFYVMAQYTAFSQKITMASVTDGLTGVYNRRYFMEFFNQKIKQIKKEQLSLSFILLDLDHFKNINDEYGHLVGDQVLKTIADLLRRNTSETDIVCRWGGEEFILLLLDKNLDETNKKAEEIRNQIESLRIKGLPQITASFGVTKFTNEDDNLSVFKRIDNSLYLAKLTGRNRVVANEKIKFDKGEPISIEWGVFFKSGNSQVDKEHFELIVLANELISHCYIEKSDEEALSLLDNIIEHIILHFENEEKILQEFNHIGLETHKSMHKIQTEKLEELLAQYQNSQVDLFTFANYIVQDVIIGHMIKEDFNSFLEVNKTSEE